MQTKIRTSGSGRSASFSAAMHFDNVWRADAIRFHNEFLFSHPAKKVQRIP
jgi:hypothetical protein